jgi:hypothetical protein
MSSQLVLSAISYKFESPGKIKRYGFCKVWKMLNKTGKWKSLVPVSA